MFNSLFDSTLEIIIYFIIVLILGGILYFSFFKKSLNKTYKVNELTGSFLEEVKVQIKWLGISYLLYFIGLAIGVAVEPTFGLFIAAVGIALSIYYTQGLEGAKIQILLEKKLGNKVSKVNVKNVENLIAKEISKNILDSMDLNEFRNEIENKIIIELKERSKS